MSAAEIRWWSYALLWPRRIAENLERVRAARIVPVTPNLWQVQLGVLRMWHRVLFRSETIGTCRGQPVRASWRARLLERRALRSVFLVGERAMAPFDFSGLASPPWRIHRHLLGAHHDGDQFVYDLQLLALHPGWLERVRDDARAVARGDDARARWLKDLVVYEGYHASLERAVAAAIALAPSLPGEDEQDPDITFTAYLRWCARQPATPEETLALWRAGLYTISGGLSPSASPTPETAARPHPSAG